MKILIISYFFPPCSLTGANRTSEWVKHLPSEGIQPILLTRTWKGHLSNFEEVLEPNTIDRHVIEFEGTPVHYIPLHTTLRDKLIGTKKIPGKKRLQKTLTLLEIFFQNLSIRFSPYRNLYFEADEILKNHRDIQTVLVSASPFNTFFIGYKLKKKYPQINWIADYRDEWTSNPLRKNGMINRLILSYEGHFEKKWLKTAAFFTYVDQSYLSRIEQSIGIKGTVVRNGIKSINPISFQPTDQNELVLTFSGTYYPDQDLSLFIKYLFLFLDENPTIRIVVQFIGAAVERGIQELLELLFKNLPITLVVKERLPKKDLIEILTSTDVALMFAFEKLPGILPTKVLEYAGISLPFLHFPINSDEISKFCHETGTGFVINDYEEFSTTLSNVLIAKKKNQRIPTASCNLDLFSSKFQTTLLAKKLKSMPFMVKNNY